MQAVLDAVSGKHGSHVPVIDGGESYLNCDRCFLKESLDECRVIPDAFRIDEKRMEVFAYEVEVTHRVSDEKLERYYQWWWALDEDYWMLRLIIVSRFGQEVEVDLFANSLGHEASDEQLAALRALQGIRRPGEAWPEFPK